MGPFSMGKKLWVIKAAMEPHVWYFPPSHLSPIYTTQKNGSVPCFYEVGPDSLFSGFGAIGGYGPKTEKKRVRTPFPDRKRCVNASSFRTIRTLFFMWACRALRWFRACALFLYFLHDGVDGVKNAENENDRVDWWRSWPTIRRFCRRDHSNRARESKMPERQKCSVPGSSEEVRTAR